MLCVIKRNFQTKGCGGFMIAGRSLIRRQMQWLRTFGIERIVVEVRDDDAGKLVRDLLAEEPALGKDARLVVTHGPTSAWDLVRMSDFAMPEHFLVILESTLMGVDPTWLFRLAVEGESVEGEVAPPPWWHDRMNLTKITLCSRVEGESSRAVVPGWAFEVATPGAALRAGGAVLTGHLLRESVGDESPVVVHGAHLGAGVWVAKGAQIHPKASIVGPVFIGADAMICKDAEVGPYTDVGPGCVIEPHVKVRDSILQADTIVGEGLELLSCVASAEGIRPLSGEGPVLDFRDPLLLDRRVRRGSGFGG